MPLYPFILMTAEQAAVVRDATAGRRSRLVPDLVAQGEYAGWYVLGTHILTLPAFAEFHDMLAALPQAELDPDLAWPPMDI